MKSSSPTPTGLTLHQQSRVLEISFDDGACFDLPCEYLRVYSPSAEVRGHSPEQAVLQIGKEDVNIVSLEPVGHYAVKIHFDDGHDSGLYSWDWLYDLGKNQTRHWAAYLDKLRASGHEHSRGQIP